MMSTVIMSKCSYKNNRKELQNSVCHLATASCWHQLVQELTKFPVLKPTFLLEKSSIFRTEKMQMFSILQQI